MRKYFWFCLIVLLLHPFVSHSSVISDLAATMSPGQWAQFSTLNINETLVDSAEGGTQHRIPYTEGMHWDPTTKKGYIFSSDDPGDSKEAMVFSEALNFWYKIADPWGPGRAHQYDAMSIDLTNRRIYNVAGDGSNSWIMNLDTQAFTSHGPVPTGFEDAEGGAYFPERGGYLQLDAGLIHKFDATTLTWIGNVASVPSGTTTYHSFAEYNPMHRIMIFGGGNLSPTNLYKMDAVGIVTRLGDAPTSLEIPRMEFAYEPVSGKFLVLRHDHTFWEYNVITDTWVALPTANIPLQVFGTSDPNQLNTILMPIPEYGVVMAVNCMFTSCTTYLYKPGTGDVVVPSSVNITTPTNGQVITTSTFGLTGTCVDDVGCVSMTYRYGTSIPTTTACVSNIATGGWPCIWSTPVNGTYNMNVQGCDSANNCTTSSTVSVTINKSNPPVSIAYVQSASKDAGIVTSTTLPFSLGTTSSNLLIACARIGAIGRILTVTDNLGNIYSHLANQAQTTDGAEIICKYGLNGGSGATTVNFSISGSAATFRVATHEYSGVSILDQTNSTQQDNTATPSSGNIITSVPNQLLFSASLAASAPSWTSGTNFVLRETPSNKIATEDRILSSIGTYVCNYSISFADNVATICASFK